MPLKQSGLNTTELVRWLSGDIKSFHIQTYEADLAQELRRGFDPRPIAITDGAIRRDPRAVKPYGRIEFLARTGAREAVEFALARLVRLSPRGPAEGGHYFQRHVVLLNGGGLSSGGLEVLDRVVPGDRVQVVNISPYAAKIEGARAKRRKGAKWRGRRGLSRQAPGGVYRKVHGELVRKYGRSLAVDFRMEQVSLDGVQQQAMGNVAWRNRGGFYVYPTLNFFVKPTIW